MRAGFHRLRKKYFREKNNPVEAPKYPIILKRLERPMKMPDIVMPYRHEEPQLADTPKSFSNDRKVIHEQRKRVFIEHIQFLSRKRKSKG